MQDLESCDRVLFLASGGRLAFAGSVADASAYFGVATVEDIYMRLAEDDPVVWATRWHDTAGARVPAVPLARSSLSPQERPGPLRQFTVLTRRTGDTLVRNRLTLAILLGSPALVVAMFAVLFRPGAFVFAHPNPSAVIMIVFWIAFGGFFFGLTYGLLQICTEMPIVRRERLVGLRLGPYLMSKVAVLLPFLLLVDLLMLGVLRALDRLPALDWPTFASLAVTLLLDAVAALALGLLTSAAVTNPAQATLALPLLCFPAVLFSGAILPLAAMAPVGRAISAVMPDRWAFEAIGHDLGLRRLFATGGSKLGPPLLAEYGSAGTHSTGFYWLVLITFTVIFLAGARSRSTTAAAPPRGDSHPARTNRSSSSKPPPVTPGQAYRTSDRTPSRHDLKARISTAHRWSLGLWRRATLPGNHVPVPGTTIFRCRLGLGWRASAVTGSQTSPTFGPGRGSSTSCSSPTPTRVASSAGRHHDHCAPTSR